MSILVAIGVLALLIVVHELGHFLAARSQGIHVNRFSIGFGPILWKYQGAETEYALRGIPLGGYVGFPDDDPDSEIPPNDPNLLKNRPILDRVIVVSAGVLANLVFAYLLLVTQVAVVGISDIHYQPGVLIPQVLADASPVAAQAGIKPGDVVLEINGQTLPEGPTALETFQRTIEQNPGQPIKLEIQRQEQQLDLTVVPELTPEGKSLIGVSLTPNATETRRHSFNPIEVLSAGARDFQRIFLFTVDGFRQLISNFQNVAGQVSGPVAIVAIGADIARSDASRLLQFAALISVNLAIINILPLPALDGGQLAFLLVEGVRGKPLPNGIQEGVMQTGLVLLLGLGVFLIVRDTANLAWVQQLFQ